MIQENNIVIDQNKTNEFISFLKRNGKSKQFWKENKIAATTPIDKNELDQLFKDN